MAKLIGNEPNQVPTNGDLGKLAFQEPEAVNITGGTLDSVTVTNLTTDGASLDGAVVINEAGADVDFRIESDTNTHALFVDAGNNRVGILNNSPATALDVTGTIHGDGLVIDATVPVLRNLADSNGVTLRLEGTGIASGNLLGQIKAETSYSLASDNPASIRLYSAGTASGHHGGFISFFTNPLSSGGELERVRITQGGTLTTYYGSVFNESSGDYDFRVESDTNTHALFVNAGNSRVSIGTSSGDGSGPTLYVEGNVHTNYVGEYAMAYRAGTYTDYYKGMRGYNMAGNSARGLHLFNYDVDGDLGITFNSGTPGGTYYEIAAFKPGATGEVVFNDESRDKDFRVESNNNANMLFVDAGNDAVGIGMEPTDRGSLAIPNGDILWMGGSYHCSVTGNGGTSNDKKLVVAFDRYSGYIQMGTIEVLFSGSRQTGGTSAAHAKVLVGFKFLNNIITVNTTTELLKYGITTISSSASGNELTITFSGSNVYSCNRLAAHCVVTMTLAEASYNGNPYSFILGNT